MNDQEKMNELLEMFEVLKETFETPLSDKPDCEVLEATETLIKQVYEIDHQTGYELIKFVGRNNPRFAAICYCKVNWFARNADELICEEELLEILFKENDMIAYSFCYLLAKMLNFDCPDLTIRLLGYLYEKDSYFTGRLYGESFSSVKSPREAIKVIISDAEKPIKPWALEALESCVSQIEDKKEQVLLKISLMKLK